MNYESMFGFGVALLWLAAIGGWLANIYKLLTTSAPIAEWTVMEIARIIGIFFGPLGAVLGYF